MQTIGVTPKLGRIDAILAREKFYLETHLAQFHVNMHEHNFLELTYITGNAVEHNLDGQKVVLREGDYCIVDYGSRHSYSSMGSNGFSNIDCLFLPELLDPVLKDTKSLRSVLEHYLLDFNMQAMVQNPSRTVFHDDTGEVRALLAKIEEEMQRHAAGYRALIRCYLIEILMLTMRRIDGVQAAATGQNISSFLTEYIAEHYMEPLTLHELATRLNYSLPYISKRFKEDTGVSFVNYLQNYRVMQGCRLLSATKHSLSEITEMVGYRDVKFFSELVKRMTGLSPRDFRRRYRRG
ncbi:MAG: helix-turn-helix domain-containing protein [Clostridia bacterium]|nr:helix-turn-helix domain-containing protein [Clostridia bacterium]